MKQKTVGFRVDGDLKTRFETIARQTGVDASTIGRELIRAIVEHVESYGELSFPIEIRTGPRSLSMVAEKRDDVGFDDTPAGGKGVT